MADLLFKDEVFKIIGASMEVHRELGNGFLEAVYQDTLCIEFKERGIPFEKEKPLNIYYKNQLLDKQYFADFVCFDEIVVELKAAAALKAEHQAQLMNYLKATGKKLGLLINFGERSLNFKRIIL